MTEVKGATTTQKGTGLGWGLYCIYSYDYGGTGVTVYIMDGGVRTNHQDFKDRIVEVQDYTGYWGL